LTPTPFGFSDYKIRCYDSTMAKPLFTILVVAPSQTASFTANSTFIQNFRDRILNEFNAVAQGSNNPKVQAGFNLEIVTDADPRAGKVSTDLPKNLFRVVLVPHIVTQPELIAKVKKLAPGVETSGIVAQMNAEGGAGRRLKDGSSAAFVSVSKVEEGLLINASPKMYAEAGRQLGGLVCHELGHALGINQNQGKGLMFGTVDIDVDQSTVTSAVHFEAPDKRIIVATLDGLAN
jgi:hypothetical protein